MPIGYMTWAYLSDDSDAGMRRGEKSYLHISEWNEGENLWVLDFLSVGVSPRGLVKEAIEKVFKKENVAFYAKRDGAGNVIRVMSWKRS